MAESIQSQYNGQSNKYLNSYLDQLYKNINWFNKELPPYNANSNKRDLALLSLVGKEPLMSGVLSTVVSRDKNRKWSLTGSARQVSKYSRNLLSVNSGRGWRDFISKMSNSFYSTNVGFAAEIGSDESGVPTTLWSFDPTEIKLIDEVDHPLEYNGGSGSVQLNYLDIIHGNSMPSVRSKHNGLGHCAVERSMRVVQIALGVLEHDLEKLGAAPPKGLMLGKGITRREFDEAYEAAKKNMSAKEREVYANVLGMFASNDKADLKLIPFSTLPDNFNFKEYVEFIIQVYALEFNYAASMLWSINTSNFNEGYQMSFDEKQTTQTGDKEFSASLQEELGRKFLPASIEFTFDDQAAFLKDQQADINDKRLDQILKIFEMTKDAVKQEQIDRPEEVDADGNIINPSGVNMQVDTSQQLLTVEQTRILLAEAGFIKSDWVTGESDFETIEIRAIRDRLCSNPSFVKRSKLMKDEPIVSFTYNDNDTISLLNDYADELLDYSFPNGKVRMVAKSSHDFIKNKYY